MFGKPLGTRLLRGWGQAIRPKPKPPAALDNIIRPDAATNWVNWAVDDIAKIRNPLESQDDQSWNHSVVNGGSASVIVRFPWPTRTPLGQQRFRVLARCVQNQGTATIRGTLMAGNNAVRVLNNGIVANEWRIIEYTWDASELPTPYDNYSLGLKLELIDALTTGYYSIEAIDWIANLSGANSGSGTELPTPLRTVHVANASQLASALSGALPGDHIILADGTYDLGGRMQLGRSGTAQHPIVVRAQNVLGAKLPRGFEFAAGTSRIWLWGIDFKDAVGSILRGTNHVIRRCRFWPKPNYANNGWAIALTPYNGSDCEVSYCELRMHTREEALAENPNLWGTGTQLGVIWNYFSASGAQAPFYRLKIARCLFTGGPHDVPYSQPNCQFIESGTNPSLGYSTNVDWKIQDCYGNVPRNSTILDFKASGMKLIRSHIECPSNGAFQLREGYQHRIERCRLGGYIEITRGPGNVVANTTAGGIFVMAGILDYNAFGSNNGDHGRAYRAVIANSNASMTIGRRYGSNFTLPALETLVEKHTGTISYDLHSATTVRPNLQDSGVTAADPVTLSASEVGPFAPWVGVEP